MSYQKFSWEEVFTMTGRSIIYTFFQECYDNFVINGD